MQLEHSFTVPVPVDRAWPVLLDIEQVAPCMPGAALDSVDGDDFTGTVKVKLGPINLTYKGKASFVSKDEGTHTAVLDASGRDSRGNGTASAKVTAHLADEGGGSTRVEVTTDLNITGKPAQFGRGVMADVGNKLIGQFADCLAGKLSAGNGAGTSESGSATAAAAADGDAEGSQSGGGTAPAGGTTPAATRPAQPREEPQPIDLLEVAGGSVLSRIGPPIALLIIGTLLFVFLRRRRHR